jgi:hypothetical protein
MVGEDENMPMEDGLDDDGGEDRGETLLSYMDRGTNLTSKVNHRGNETL